MFKFIKNLIAAQRNATALATVKADLADLERKAINIVSHATGGHLADITGTLNDICVEISISKNHVWKHAQASKAAELAGDLLHSMHETERRVLVILHDFYCRTMPTIAEEVGITVDEVRTIVKGFVIKGLANFGRATDDEGRPSGSGYTLTDEGKALKVRQLAADVTASADAAKALGA